MEVQQPGTRDPSPPTLVKLAKEIWEAINIKAGVSDADVSGFFVDEEVVDPVESAAAEVQLEEEPQPGELASPPQLAVVSTVPSVIITTQQSTSSGAGSIAASVATRKARTQQNKLVGAIESLADSTSATFASFMQQWQMAEDFEWRQRRLECKEERARREEERSRHEEELQEMRRKESR
jgi:hypothetical protein